MKRIYVKTMYDDRYHDFKKGDVGYIDGYIQGGDSVPYIVVIFKNKLSLVQISGVEVIKHRIITKLINFLKNSWLWLIYFVY